MRGFPSGPRVQAATGVSCCPSWRRDGRELYYQSREGALIATAVRGGTEIDFGKAERLMDLPVDSTGYWLPSPDGQRFLVATQVSPAAAPSPVTVVVNWMNALKQIR